MKALWKNIAQKKKKQEEFPKFIFDKDYQLIRVKELIEDEEDIFLDRFQLINHNRADLAQKAQDFTKNFEGFERSCREFFQDLLLKIKLQRINNIKAKFLFIDAETSILFHRLITWFEMKDAGISCLFILNEDYVSNDLTEHATLFYVVSINYLKKFQNEFTKELRDRKCLKKIIYLREHQNYLEEKQAKFIDEIVQITKSEMNFLGVYLPINDLIILIDNCTSSFERLVKLLKGTNFQNIENLYKDKKYYHHLAYLLFKNNLNPCIRYLSNFNTQNKKLAESTFQILQKFYQLHNTLKSANQNCLLLIIDRSLDFLTPLLHSKNYFQFVNQELGYVLDVDFVTLDRKLENISLRDVAGMLISISKKMTIDELKLNNQKSISQLALFNRKAALLGKHIEYVNQVRNRLQCGYQHFLTLEEQLLNQNIDQIFNDQESENKNIENESRRNHMKKYKDSPSFSNANLKKLPDENRSKRRKNNKISNDNDSKKIELDKEKAKNLLIQNELINLEQSEFIDFLIKILKNEKNPLDWKRILCLYSVVKEPLSSSSKKKLKKIMTKEMIRELNNFVTIVKNVSKRNQFDPEVKFVSLASLIKDVHKNLLDENMYPAVNTLVTNPKKLLIFMSGGISFNEMNLARKSDTVLISDCIFYPKLFLNLLNESASQIQ